MLGIVLVIEVVVVVVFVIGGLVVVTFIIRVRSQGIRGETSSERVISFKYISKPPELGLMVRI
jgi:hypothetical protein